MDEVRAPGASAPKQRLQKQRNPAISGMTQSAPTNENQMFTSPQAVVVDARPLCVSVDAVTMTIHKHQPVFHPSTKSFSHKSNLIGSSVYNNTI